MSKKESDPGASTTVAIPVTTFQDRGFLRESWGTCTLPDGRQAEVCGLFGRGVFIQIGKDQHIIASKDLVQAIFEQISSKTK